MDRPIRVLLVEDDPDDAWLVQRMMAADGEALHFTHVDTLKAARDRLAIDEFDVILLDLSLPDSRGVNTCSALRRVAPQTPIVVLLLGWSRLIERQTMAKYRRHVVMVCAVVSAIVTPADAVSMLMLGIPMYLLFELGMLLLMVLPAERVARGFGPKPRRGETRDGQDPGGEDLSARPDDE